MVEVPQDDKQLFTFVVEFDGGTYCSQFHAQDIDHAVELYNTSNPFDVDAIPISEPVRLNGLMNIWFASEKSEDSRTILANIVKTAT